MFKVLSDCVLWVCWAPTDRTLSRISFLEVFLDLISTISCIKSLWIGSPFRGSFSSTLIIYLGSIFLTKSLFKAFLVLGSTHELPDFTHAMNLLCTGFYSHFFSIHLQTLSAWKFVSPKVLSFIPSMIKLRENCRSSHPSLKPWINPQYCCSFLSLIGFLTHLYYS